MNINPIYEREHRVSTRSLRLSMAVLVFNFIAAAVTLIEMNEVVDYARKLGVNPETAITRANEKFHRRFSFVQKRMEENNFPKDFGYIDMMESFWNEAKSKGL